MKLSSQQFTLLVVFPVTCQMAVFECPSKQWLQSFLPALYRRFGRQAVLKENKLAARFDYAFHLSNGIDDAGNGAHGEGAEDGVDGATSQRDALAGKADKFDVQFCLI